jgi:alginate O-acetyltransferase complex protein AlgI
VIPVYDSFDWFASLIPLLVVLVPALVVLRFGRARQVVLTVAGLYLLALVAPRLAVLHLVIWLVVAALVPLVAATGERRAGLAALFAALAVVLVPMVAWKVWPHDFVVEMNVWTNKVFRPFDTPRAIEFTAPIVAPIGLSFSSFRAADLLVKSSLGLVGRLSPGRVLAYGLFPPLLVVGPIATYDEVAPTLDRHVPVDRERALRGGLLMVSGLVKVFVFAYLLSWSGDIFEFYADNSAWRVWVSLLAFTIFFYVNFAGYSDLAIGTGHLLGADLRPNFASPYTKPNPAAFWNSWHISLTRFLRANVFTPLVAGRPQRQYAATVLLMVLIGLWHSVTWASLAFGVYHGVSLVAHRWVERRRPASDVAALRWLKPAGVVLWYALSLPLLQLGLRPALEFYGALVGVRV